MFQDNGFALLIGIDDYSAFDRSRGQPAGTSQLAGSVLDAHVFWRLCLQFGMAPENIRVAASPRPDLALLPGATAANLVDATEAGLREAVGWLAGRLGAGHAGLLTYSGHGAHARDRGLLVCPSDTSGASFDHAIPFDDLRALLGGGAANLTVVLDCCHGGGGAAAAAADARGRVARTLGGDPLAPGERPGEMLIGARVLAACQPGEVTQQASFGGKPHGAFSWALGAIMEQWQVIEQGGNARLDLSYGELVARARQLLAVLDFPGTPTLYGAPGTEALAVLQVGARRLPTSPTPDGPRTRVQMDPGQKQFRYYSLLDASGALVASVLVPRVDGTLGGTSFAAGKEYWRGVSTSPPSRALTVTWEDHDWDDPGLPTPGPASFTMQQDPDWRSLRHGSPPSGQSLFANMTLHIALDWQLSSDGGAWGGALRWFDTTGRSTVFSGSMPAGGVTLEAGVATNHRGVTWFEASVSPQ